MWEVKRTTMRDEQGVLREDYALFGSCKGKPVALRLDFVQPDRRKAVAERLAARLNEAPETVKVPVLRVDVEILAEAPTA